MHDIYAGCQKHVPKTWPTNGHGIHFNRNGNMTTGIDSHPFPDEIMTKIFALLQIFM